MTLHHRVLAAQLPLADLPPAQVQRCRAVLHTLAELADSSGTAWPSRAALAAAAGLDARPLQRALTLLELGGWLTRRRGRAGAATYRINFDPPGKRPPWRACRATGHQHQPGREQRKRRPTDTASRTSTHPEGRR